MPISHPPPVEARTRGEARGQEGCSGKAEEQETRWRLLHCLIKPSSLAKHPSSSVMCLGPVLPALASFFRFFLLQRFDALILCSCYFPVWRAIPFYLCLLDSNPFRVQSQCLIPQEVSTNPIIPNPSLCSVFPQRLVSATDTILSSFAHASLADTASSLAGNDRREAHMRDGRTGGGPWGQGGDNPQGCICVEEASGCPLQTSCALSGYHRPHHALHCLHWVCLM